jgi:crotonobetainyl-CoA:carnitine CoA-transferase CaiB-like acyl-CoA transferase
MGGAFDDIEIVDFSRVLAGPFATMLLADFGARVLKVERPDVGDDTRGWGPPYDAAGDATYFQAVNRNKRSVVLDLRDPADRDEAQRLALGADVVVENFRPGVMEQFSLGYDDLAPRNVRLIYCSITGFGRGHGAELPGYDLLIQALGGLMSITGSPTGEPQKVGVALVDVLAGLFSTLGIMAALRHRDQTGEGQRVDVSLLLSLLAALTNQAAAWTVAGEIPQRLGNDHPSVTPYGLLRAADGDLVVAVGNQRQFVAFCDAIGAPEIVEDPRFETNAARVTHRDELRAALEVRLSDRPAAEWATLLSARRVPAGTVNDVSLAFRLAEELGLEPIVELPREDGTAVRLARNPVDLSKTPASYRFAPPRLPTSGRKVSVG